MDPELLELMDELVAAIELRDASDPDAPAWEAEARIQRLEAEVGRRMRLGSALSAGLGEEVLAGTA